MMALLRSRRVLLLLVGLIALGMVATGAAGLFTAMSTPTAEEQQAAQQEEAPSMSVLGQAPTPVGYVEVDHQCQQGECYRTIGLDVSAEDLDAAETLELVRDDLMDKGWQPLVADSGTDPEDIPAEEFVLTDGSSLLMASPTALGDSVPASVVLGSY